MLTNDDAMIEASSQDLGPVHVMKDDPYKNGINTAVAEPFAGRAICL